MKIFLIIILQFVSFFIFSQFSENPDWTFNRTDHKLHLFVGYSSAFIVSSLITFKQDTLNIKNGLIYGGVVSSSLGVGKEIVWDMLLNKGVPTYPDLVYTLTGAVIGLLQTYIIYHVHKNNNNKTKL